MVKQMSITRKLWNGHTQDRVATTSNILAQVREIKMLGLAPSMTSHLQKLHNKEVEVSLTDRRILCIIFGISEHSLPLFFLFLSFFSFFLFLPFINSH